jgi:hypothetical protein
MVRPLPLAAAFCAGGIMEHDDILNHYRHFRAITIRHQNAALNFVARPALLERAKYLGLVREQSLVVDSETMPLVFDLALHTAKPGRSRAIDRYARTAALCPDTDEGRVLEAVRHARFSIWKIERRHEVSGLVIADLLRESETWLVDEALTTCAKPGLAFAGRLCRPADFAMTCGVIVPIDYELMEDVVLSGMGWMGHTDPAHLADDPRFATAVYRAAVKGRVMERVEFREVAIAS